MSHLGASTSEPSIPDPEASLPFSLGPEMMEEIREYLIQEEGLDPTDDAEMQAAIYEMAREMCDMAVDDSDAELQEEIRAGIEAAARPYAEAQQAWEARMHARGHDVPDFREVDTGFESMPGMPIPDSVDPRSLATILQWEEETRETREGPLGSIGWAQEDGGIHPAAAAMVIGIGGWNIGPKMHPQIQDLATDVESLWRQMFPGDLARAPMDPRWRVVDSCNPNAPEVEWSVSDPKPGQDGYPRMVIENRAYATRQFRSLHIELVIRSDGFQVMHCVMWPRREFDIPILAFDVVIANGKVQYFIADASPVRKDRQLPDVYIDALRMLRAQFVGGFTESDVNVPDWGKTIFSEDVVAVRPDMPAEAGLCVSYVVALTRMHLLFAKRAEPVPESDSDRLAEIDASHRKYCQVQRQNQKTLSVLQRAFKHLGEAGDVLVARYLLEVLFDHEFTYDVSDDVKEALLAMNEGSGVAQPSPEAGKAAAEALDNAVRALRQGFEEAEADQMRERRRS